MAALRSRSSCITQERFCCLFAETALYAVQSHSFCIATRRLLLRGVNTSHGCSTCCMESTPQRQHPKQWLHCDPCPPASERSRVVAGRKENKRLCCEALQAMPKGMVERTPLIDQQRRNPVKGSCVWRGGEGWGRRWTGLPLWQVSQFVVGSQTSLQWPSCSSVSC